MAAIGAPDAPVDGRAIVPWQLAGATSVMSMVMLPSGLGSPPVIRTLDAADRSFNAFWTIWSAVSPARGAGVADVRDLPDGRESTVLADPDELQAAVERMITAVRIPARTLRMRDGTGVSFG